MPGRCLIVVLGTVASFEAVAQTNLPPDRSFGSDSTSTDLFTGAGQTQPGLTCASSAAEVDCSGFLPSDVDGTLLDVTVRVPAGPAPHPLVVNLHGYGGSKNSSSGWDDQIVARGYAVLRYSARGFGKSWGQVNLADSGVELPDLRSMIGQVVDDERLGLDADAVAVLGASYGGGQSWLAALQPRFSSPGRKPVRIRTIVPIVPWIDLLASLRPNGRATNSIDVPGFFKLSFTQGLFATGARTDSERPYPNYPAYLLAWDGYIAATEPNNLQPVGAQIVDGVAGYRSIWWQKAFFDAVATNATNGAPQLPVFELQGFTDDLFPLPEAVRMYRALKELDPHYPIAEYFGDVGHPRAQNKAGEVQYALDRVFEWLDFYLKGIGTASGSCGDPAPQLRCDVLAAITRPAGTPFDAGDVLRVDALNDLATATVVKRMPGNAVLTFDPANLGGLFSDPFVFTGCEELQGACPAPPPDGVPGDVGVFTVPARSIAAQAQLSSGTFLVAGQPVVSFTAQTAAPRVQLDVRLYEVKATGESRLITRGTWTLDSGSALPLGAQDMRIPTYGNLMQVDATDSIRLEVTNVDTPYLEPSRVASVTRISNVELEVPLRRP